MFGCYDGSAGPIYLADCAWSSHRPDFTMVLQVSLRATRIHWSWDVRRLSRFGDSTDPTPWTFQGIYHRSPHRTSFIRREVPNGVRAPGVVGATLRQVCCRRGTRRELVAPLQCSSLRGIRPNMLHTSGRILLLRVNPIPLRRGIGKFLRSDYIRHFLLLRNFLPQVQRCACTRFSPVPVLEPRRARVPHSSFLTRHPTGSDLLRPVAATPFRRCPRSFARFNSTGRSVFQINW